MERPEAVGRQEFFRPELKLEGTDTGHIVPSLEEDVTHFPEDDDPESHIGEPVEDSED